MPRRLQNSFLACWAVIFAAALFPAGAQSNHDKYKNVSNFEGGILQATDGALPNGACFRMRVKVDAEDFFDTLKREDTRSGILYRRGNDVVTNFPKQLQLSLSIADFPCDPHLQQTGSRVYLTDEMIRTLRLSFYWKRGLELRPAKGVEPKGTEVSLVPNYYQGPNPPPQKYEWLLDFEVPSEGVPLTDSLVMVLRTPDHHIVARTAARL